MGIGWIGKIVLFDNNDRVIAYIMTGFVASQGVFIFILLGSSIQTGVPHYNYYLSY